MRARAITVLYLIQRAPDLGSRKAWFSGDVREAQGDLISLGDASYLLRASIPCPRAANVDIRARQRSALYEPVGWRGVRSMNSAVALCSDGKVKRVIDSF